jgi:signal transduction histidine kinase
MGHKSSYEIEMIRADGDKRSVRVIAAPNYDISGAIIGSVGIFEDITEQKVNEVIRAKQEQEINLYSSLLRHDLRNDLGLVISYIEVIQMLLEDPDDEVVGFLNSALASTERMTNLLKYLGQPQELVEVDIVEYLQVVANEAQEAEKTIRITVKYSHKSEPTKIITGSFLSLVFMNLFRNSAQHAGENPKIDVYVTRTDDWVEIQVTDNGPGIPEEFKDNLFSRGTSTKGELGGLGLHLSRQIIHGVGGTIELDKDAKSATFIIRLPLIER